jgi:hypothetical protein
LFSTLAGITPSPKKNPKKMEISTPSPKKIQKFWKFGMTFSLHI